MSHNNNFLIKILNKFKISLYIFFSLYFTTERVNEKKKLEPVVKHFLLIDDNNYTWHVLIYIKLTYLQI